MIPGFQSIPEMLEDGGARVHFHAFDASKDSGWFTPGVSTGEPGWPEIFNEAEYQRIMSSALPVRRLALEWVGKQAVSRALTWSGNQEIGLRDFEIWYDPSGAPWLRSTRGEISDSTIGKYAISMSADGPISLGVSAAIAPLSFESTELLNNHILGIGVDVVSFEQLEGMPESIWPTVLRHTFSVAEIEKSIVGKDRAMGIKLLSAVFAGKEAVFKAMSRLLYQEWIEGRHPGRSALDFREIEILNVGADRGVASLPDGLLQIARRSGVDQITIQFFFEPEFVVALALCCRDHPIP